MMHLVLLILLIFLVVGVAPLWPYSVGWGIAPASGVGFILLILLVLLLLGRL
jgi:low affinity Fe/Cu permease